MSDCQRCRLPLATDGSCPRCDPKERHRTRVTMSSTRTMSGARAVSVTLDLPAEFLARYELGRSLGKGGMGEVFAARDLELDRQVAVKFCLAHTDPEARERFEQEAALMARIHHPNVVGVLATGQIEKIPYLVMPLVKGESLRRLLARRKEVPLDEAIPIIKQVLAALAAAHLEGVIHRDLKPENILVTQDGQAMLLDLGVARSWADGSAFADTKQITGTPAYMSPEQGRGEPTGVASDIYSTGIILFEMLAGEPPFAGPTPMATLRAHVETRIPRISDRCPSLEPHWDNVLARALAKLPADRFQDAGAFAMALEKSVSGQYAAAHLPAIKDLEGRQLTALSRSPVATAVGIVILAGLGVTSACALLGLDFPLAFAAPLPFSTIFMSEEPGRFKQLTARGSMRLAVWVCSALAVFAIFLFGGVEEFLKYYLTFWTLAAVHLAWFGGYHNRDPRDRSGVELHRRANVLVLAMTILIVAAFGSTAAITFASASLALAILGLLRPPARTRHLSIGTATTMILMGRMDKPDEEASRSHPRTTVIGPRQPLPRPNKAKAGPSDEPPAGDDPSS